MENILKLGIRVPVFLLFFLKSGALDSFWGIVAHGGIPCTMSAISKRGLTIYPQGAV